MDIEEIIEMNGADGGQKRSSYDYLRGIGAFKDEILCRVADELEDMDHCICSLFQVPKVVKIQPNSISLRTHIPGHSITFVFLPIFLRVADNLSVQLLTKRDSSEELTFSATQVLAYCPVWDKYRKYYSSYLDAITDEGLRDILVEKPRRREHEKESKTAAQYEANLAGRSLTLIAPYASMLLDAYSLCSITDSRSKTLYNYFTMTAPGRITVAQKPIPLLKAYMAENSRWAPKISCSKLNAALEFKFRKLESIHESLSAMTELGRRGEHASAMVGIVSALEKYLKSQIDISNIRGRVYLMSLLRDPKLNGLDQRIVQALHHTIYMRNLLVHSAKNTSSSLELVYSSALAALECAKYVYKVQ